jgi:adenylate kinase
MEIKKFAEFNINEKEHSDKQGKILIVLGAPGSGKGTLAKELESRYGIKHISTGEIIRNSDNPELKEIVEGGKFIPDDMMVKILRKELKSIDPSNGIIFDGFPRTIKQSKKLDSILGRMGLGLSNVIFLDLPEDIAKKRIESRAKKENRKDDISSDVINKRFDEYHEKTYPLLDFYKSSRKLVRINAEDGKDSVFATVVKKLNLKKPKS